MHSGVIINIYIKLFGCVNTKHLDFSHNMNSIQKSWSLMSKEGELKYCGKKTAKFKW